jgi:hypothetical protein
MTQRKQTEKKSPGTVKEPQKSAPAPTSGKTTPVRENRRKTGGGFGVTVPPEVGRATQFKPGESGNPGGRPRTRGLLDVLRGAVKEVRPDGRTVEEAVVATLIEEALESRNPLGAIQTIFDRLEGRPKQAIDFNDITEAMKGRSADDLLHFAQHGTWPEESMEEEAKDEE